MNLQEQISRMKSMMGLMIDSNNSDNENGVSIQKTISEEVKSTFVKRRYDILIRYIRSAYNWLSPDRFKDFDEFIGRVIFSTIRDFTSDEGGTDYNKILELRKEIGGDIEEIIMNKFRDEIYEYYKNNK